MKDHAERIVNAIREVDVQSRWKDDHITCVGANITFDDGYTQNVTFNWCGDEYAAALVYYDHPKAKTDLYSLVEDYLEAESNNLLDLADDPTLAEGDHPSAAPYREARALFDHFNVPVEF